MVLGVLVIVVSGILVLNYFKNTKGINLFKTGEKGASTEATVKGEHTVAKGESLWKIAQSYYGDGYKWVEVAKANNISDANAIEVGQKLTLPDLKQEAVKEPVQNQKEAISGATYAVVKNDNLWTIAVRAYGDGYKWVEIARENKLVNPNLIYPGSVLVLPR